MLSNEIAKKDDWLRVPVIAIISRQQQVHSLDTVASKSQGSIFRAH